MKTCTISGCAGRAKARGLCSRHYNRAYYAEHAEEQRERSREWYRHNLERAAARNRRRDPAIARAAARTWYRNNRLRAVAYQANAKARKLGIVGVLTAEGLAARLAFFHRQCWVCGAADADSIDHVKPLGAGGLNVHANIRPACLSCNAARSWEGRR